MTDEERYGSIRATPRNPYVGAAADAAGGVRQFLNKAQIPVLGGAGDLFVGEAPEEIDRWAHGFHPFKDRNVPGYSGLRIPEIQEKRAGPVADALFLGADATGIGMGTAALGKAGLRSAGRQFQQATSDAAMDASRRKFVKNAGIAGGAAAVASATPDLLKGLTRTVAKAAPDPTTAATRVAKNSVGSVGEFYARLRGMRAYSHELESKYIKELENSPTRKKELADLEEAMRKQKEAFPGQVERGEAYADEPDWLYDEMDDALMDYHYGISRDASELAQMDYEEALHDFLRQNPEYADLPDINTIRRTKFEDLPNGPDFLKRTGYLPTDNDVAHHLRRGGEYTDPVTGNTARLIPDAPPPMPGHKGTRFDIEWVSPDGSVAPYQHWLPDYVPDKLIGTRQPDGRFIGDKGYRPKQYRAPQIADDEFPF